ncbi:MAG TPA: alpha/beta hydrolase [Gaiellales bacterium]|nr:alpha/beta hydrolase [Gaiellales bacterium]
MTSRDGVRLACRDHGGEGPAAVVAHGLAGHAGEWDGTAAWLGRTHRVVAPDARGHGRSERRPADVSRAACVDDLAGWIELLGLAPAVVIGQSLGGHTAFLLAARRPELVRALVVGEAAPPADPDAPATVETWLRSWPAPFAGREDALRFFGDTTWGRAWADGLERRDDGLWPAFDVDVMVASLAETSQRDYWDEWRRVSCPTLVVRAGDDGVPAELVERMVAEAQNANSAVVPDAGHDLHLYQPEHWREAVEPFLQK